MPDPTPIPDPSTFEGDGYAAVHARIRTAPGDTEALVYALTEVLPVGTDARRTADALLVLLDVGEWALERTVDRDPAPSAEDRQRAAEIIAGSGPIADRIRAGVELVTWADDLARYLDTGQTTPSSGLALTAEQRDAFYLELHAMREALCLLSVQPGEEVAVRGLVQGIDRLGSTLSMPGQWSKDNRSHEEPF